jgi:radical SAM protein with 4Fe4S-binding SPASM domain
VARASTEGRATALVTSGAALTPALAERLAQAGLGSLTFSLDAGEADLAEQLRPGVPFRRTREAMVRASEILGDRVPRAVFTAVCAQNAHRLDPVADLARQLGARAWMLSDLNFAFNRDRSLAGGAGDRGAAARSVARALEAGLPVLDVRALEELGKPFRLREWLLRPVERLWTRPDRHTHCLSPWQTMAVGSDGTVTACDCQPGVTVGNLLEDPQAAFWNGPEMRRLRRELLEGRLREACRGCPRL